MSVCARARTHAHVSSQSFVTFKYTWDLFIHFSKVDRRQAGQSDLDVIVTSPLGEALPVEVKALNQVQGDFFNLLHSHKHS